MKTYKQYLTEDVISSKHHIAAGHHLTLARNLPESHPGHKLHMLNYHKNMAVHHEIEASNSRSQRDAWKSRANVKDRYQGAVDKHETDMNTHTDQAAIHRGEMSKYIPH